MTDLAFPKPKKRGRPTKYDKSYCDEIIRYFNIEPNFESPVTITYKDGTTREEMKMFANNLPTLAGFASKIGVNRDTLNEWMKQHKEFSDAIKEAKEHQEQILVENGLQGLYQGPFAIFTAKNVIGWRDKSEIEQTGNITMNVEIVRHKIDENSV